MDDDRIDVVVVDDAEDVRSVVARHLQLSGRFKVVAEGASGHDAITLASEHQPTLMLLDASMPGLDGLSALPRVLQSSVATRVVLFSGFTSPVLEQTARHLGAADVIDKGSPIRHLAEQLLNVMGDAHTSEPPRQLSDALTEDGDSADLVLAQHLERFRSVFDQGAIGMATMTLTGTIVRANAALCAIFEVDEGSLVGRPYIDLLRPTGSHEALRAALVDVASGDRTLLSEEHRVRGAQRRWVHSTIAAVRDAVGDPLYLFTQTEDVTERHLAAEALQAGEERFRLLVEGVRDYAIFMLDPDGRVTTWNTGAERMKGYRAEEIIGEHFRIFYQPEAQQIRHPEHELELAVRDGQYEEEGWRLRKDGTRFWANVLITALFHPDGRLAGFAKVTRDITERRLAAEAAEQAATELELANRRLKESADERAQFLAMTAHELSSPVAAMTGAADIMLEHWDEMEATERAESLTNIVRGGIRIRRLLEDLLMVARLEAGSFEFLREEVPLAKSVEEAVSAEPGSRQIVRVEIRPDLCAFADRTRTVQIVANLLSNAKKYGRPPIRVDARSDGRFVTVRVHDAGVPTDPVTAARFFDKFFQGPAQGHKGTGLGLFIVRELARGQGGDAWYEVDDAGGSCFCFSLLLSKGQMMPGEHISPSVHGSTA